MVTTKVMNSWQSLGPLESRDLDCGTSDQEPGTLLDSVRGFLMPAYSNYHEEVRIVRPESL